MFDLDDHFDFMKCAELFVYFIDF